VVEQEPAGQETRAEDRWGVEASDSGSGKCRRIKRDEDGGGSRRKEAVCGRDAAVWASETDGRGKGGGSVEAERGGGY